MSRRLWKLAIATAGTLVAATLTAPPALAAPTLEVAPATGLVDDQIVTVTGSEISTTTYPIGVYVTQAAIIDGVVRFNAPPRAVWVTAASITDGELTTDVTVDATFTSGGVEVDCTQDACLMITWRAHTNPTPATIVAQAPIAFRKVAVTPAAGLEDGDTLTIAGEGFEGVGDPTHGFYVTQAAIVDGDVRYANARQVSPSPTTSTMWQLQPDGTFGGTIPATRTFTQGGHTVDCAVTPCEIVTFRARSAPTVATLYTRTPIAFAADPGPDPGPGPGPTPSGPSIAVSPSSGLTGPTGVTVTGSGFSTTPPGIYVVYGPMAGNTNASAYHQAGQQFLSPGGGLSSTGTFATTLQVVPTYTDGNGNVVNCTVVQCYVRTMRAHGMTDVNQDTAVPITFASTVATGAPDAAPPAPTATGGPAASTSGSGAAAPSGSAPMVLPTISKPRVRRSGRVAVRVSEPATVTFVLRRKQGRRWVVVKVVRVRVSEAGVVRARLPLRRAGRYRVSTKAVSSVTGKASTTSVKRITVKRAKKKGARR